VKNLAKHVVTFDVDEEHKLIIKQNLRSKEVLDKIT
jgi:predicted O-methyltransferase YrrM